MNTKITYQSYGNSILLFITGETRADSLGKWTSLANWGATSFPKDEADPEFVDETTISCWSTREKLQEYFFNLRLMELWGDKYKGVKGGCANDARALAAQDFAAISHEAYRSVNNNIVEHGFGTINAEREDMDFKDCCYKAAFA